MVRRWPLGHVTHSGSARSRGRSGVIRTLAISAAAATLIFSADLLLDDNDQGVAAAGLPPASYGPASYAAELAASDRQIALMQERVASAQDEWLPHETLARAALSRFKLNADPGELALAANSIQRSNSLSPEGSGPLLTSAEIAMAQHDLKNAETFLGQFDQIVVSPGKPALSTAVALRGDVSFYHGDMELAESLYEEADEIIPTPGTAIRKSILARSQGQFDEAIALIREAARRDQLRTPRSMASYELQIGMVESARGNYEVAAQSYARADELFPGHWLTQFYRAEAQAMIDELTPAITTFERIATQTNDPQAMDAAATLHIANGDMQAAERWSNRSAAGWRTRVEAMPMAYTAHAFESALAFGKPEQALDLALRNLAMRPYGEAHILVAEAFLANDRPAQARAHLLRAEQQGWRSAPLYARLSEAEAQLGNAIASRTARAQAEQLNPHIFSPKIGRLWFGHG
ncbi:hypothetical protein CP97_03170 [Aurantiacibacter atlanticus]|uniref:Tetratricopeptide repeat protein n=1 Tax=Aurantiacibacter atlanticus TaxID=1648404 RepID=A0A0H4VW38_9SPHN|nr:hypothetical protein [Aurantiacibacter atlanticus]AKQ41253.1 hypothetical protein CP97_03170 [Aurantiacibacter atlanticus]MDF1835095.1 hypothetical protein [Alteraurantiacibacter sp. bin_em_oilr2.035]